MTKFKKGQSPWNKGKKWSEDEKKKMSESHIGKIPWNKGKEYTQIKGENHYLYGKHLSEATKKKLSEAHIGKKYPPKSEETKRKLSISLKGKLAGEKHPNYGKHRSEITRQKISKAHIGKTVSAVTKNKISKAFRGRFVGEKHPMYGKHQTEETKIKHSKFMKELWNKSEFRDRMPIKTGIEHSGWKGGKKLSKAREHHRRRLLGFVLLNTPFKNSEAHHIDKEYVIYIPEKVHSSNPHSLTKPESMVKINRIAIHYLNPAIMPILERGVY